MVHDPAMREVDKEASIFSFIPEQNSFLYPWTKRKNNQKFDTLKEFIHTVVLLASFITAKYFWHFKTSASVEILI